MFSFIMLCKMHVRLERSEHFHLSKYLISHSCENLGIHTQKRIMLEMVESTSQSNSKKPSLATSPEVVEAVIGALQSVQT